MFITFYKKNGFTLVELLCSIAIVAVLLGLLLVAVNRSRESARLTTCQNNLKQIGIGTSSYTSAKKHFPKSSPSLLFQIADHLEIIIDEPSDEVVWYPILLCPSDSLELSPYQLATTEKLFRARINYQGCTGIYPFRSTGYQGLFSYTNGVYGYLIAPLKIRPSMVKDGLSNTVLASESLRGSIQENNRRLRTLWNPPHNAKFEDDEFEQFRELCLSMPSDPFKYGWRGSDNKGNYWVGPEGGGMSQTLYNHALPPNSPNCTNFGSLANALASANSEHNSGVNVLFADGHVTFVSNNIDRIVWEAISTRNSSEVVNFSNY